MRYKKVISKVIKMNDLRNKDIEHVKDKCLEYWEVVDIDIRDVFSYILYSKLKYINRCKFGKSQNLAFCCFDICLLNEKCR